MLSWLIPDCANIIRRADKQRLRQVDWNIQIMIEESNILLRIEQLQQSGARIALISTAEFVNLIN